MSNTSTGREIEGQIHYLLKMMRAHFANEHPDPDQTEPCKYLDDVEDELLALIASHTNAALDRIEESVKQHTIPEGKHLVTRSYVLNTLEFERNRIQKESA